MSNSTSDIQMGGVGVDGRRFHVPVAAATTIYEGVMVAQLVADGMLVPASTADSGPVIGVSTHKVDNSTGAAGDLRCVIETDRIYRRTNGTAGNAFSEASPIGSPCYAFDDHTVYDNSAAGTLQFAGSFYGMEPGGKVRVMIAPSPALGADEEFENGLATDTISELTAATGVTIDSVLVKDAKITASGGADLGASPGLLVDIISEKTGAAGVTIDGVLVKDGGIVCADAATIEVDTIGEATGAAGVTIDGVLHKDNKVTASGGIDAGATPGVLTDIISEKTGAAGVTVDSLLVKDAALPGFMPGISLVQVAGGTFVNGTATINTGIVVTADTDAFVIMSAVITGSTNVGAPAHLKASNSVGGAGVGAVTLNILGDDGAVDGDAAGAFRVLLIN